jgi:hypothetical protein
MVACCHQSALLTAFVKRRREEVCRVMRGDYDSHLPTSRSQDGRWQPGQSANPGGRPAIEREVISLAREHSLDSIRTLVAIRDDPDVPPAVRAFCANSVLDRAIGKVREYVDGDDHERVEMVEALVTALRVGGVRTQRRVIGHDSPDDSNG